MITEITMRFRPDELRQTVMMECQILGGVGEMKIRSRELRAEVDEMYLRCALDDFKEAVLKAARGGK